MKGLKGGGREKGGVEEREREREREREGKRRKEKERETRRASGELTAH